MSRSSLNLNLTQKILQINLNMLQNFTILNPVVLRTLYLRGVSNIWRCISILIMDTMQHKAQQSKPTHTDRQKSNQMTEWEVRGWQHLSLARTQSEDPVTVELVQFDRLMKAALVDTNSSTVTCRGQKLQVRNSDSNLLFYPVIYILTMFSDTWF